MQSFQQKFFKKESNKIAVRCDIRWQTRKGPNLDGLPGRGFGALINFYTPGSPEPVKVDGDVRIYVFDNQGTPEENKRPFHQFDFGAKTFNAYLSEGDIGLTYGLFIPYTRPGNRQATVSLMLRMTPKIGPVVLSDMVTIQLAGTKPDSKKQVTGLNAKEFDLNRSDSVQTMVDTYRRQTSGQIENPLQNANSKQPPTRKITSELATKKLFQLLNEQMKSGVFAKIEERKTNATSNVAKNPLEILPNTESTTLPDRVPKTVPSTTPRKRFRLTPAPGAAVVKTSGIEPVRTILHPEVKSEPPVPTPPLALPSQSNEWLSLDE